MHSRSPFSDGGESFIFPFPFSFTLLPCKSLITPIEENHIQSEISTSMGGSCLGGDDYQEDIRSCDYQELMTLSHDIRRRGQSLRSGEDETSVLAHVFQVSSGKEYSMILQTGRNQALVACSIRGRRVIDQAAILQLIAFHAFHATDEFYISMSWRTSLSLGF